VATRGEVVITRRGKPIGVLIGFESDEDWWEYMLLSHPAFQKRIAKARAEIRAGRGIRLEDIPTD
jgi:PHD/YefM family antitoxin component YafN of YafNO toxin-antitoxin module